MRRLLHLLLIALCGPALAGTVTILSGLDTQEEVDQFASLVRYSMVEPVRSPRTQGRGAMRIRFFGHPSLDSDPRVQAGYHFKGLRYTNWTPYDHLLVDIYNPGEEDLEVAVVIRGPRNWCSTPVAVRAGEWETARIRIDDLRREAIDTDNVTALQLRMELHKQRWPSRIVVDNVRLIGADVAAIRKAREEGDKRRARQPVRRKPRTRAILDVVQPSMTGTEVAREQEVPVVATTEVLVVGGGLAGTAAAVTAARMGAEAILIERTGALGGMATTGLVPPAFNVGLAEGIVAEFCDRLDEVAGRRQNRNPEIMKHVLLDMMRESGAKLMLYSLAVDAIMEGNSIRGVIVENKSGTQAVMADIVIDCTGDGDVAAAAGAPFEIGRGRDTETQTQTLIFLLGNVNTSKMRISREDMRTYIRKAREEGNWEARFSGGAAIQPVVRGQHGVVNVNTVNIPAVSGLDVADLTYSHIAAQEDAMAMARFFREYVPGFEGCYLLKTADYIGVRESRRIVGEHILTGEEVLCAKEFPDAIARGFYPIDIHSPDRTGDAAGPTPHKPYAIPYRCLVPKQIDNLLVAGRCISADHVAHGSLRVMGTTMPLGEAAGCAAAMCIADGTQPRELSGEAVRQMLRDFECMPKYGTRVPDNIALAENGTEATADSIYDRGGHIPTNAIDGIVTEDSMSRWLSSAEPGPHWLQLEFPEPKTFSSVELYLFAFEDQADITQYIPQGFDVQVEEGEEWRTVASVTDNTELRPRVEFEEVTAKVMRVVFTVSCPSDDIVRLREVVVK